MKAIPSPDHMSCYSAAQALEVCEEGSLKPPPLIPRWRPSLRQLKGCRRVRRPVLCKNNILSRLHLDDAVVAEIFWPGELGGGHSSFPEGKGKRRAHIERGLGGAWPSHSRSASASVSEILSIPPLRSSPAQVVYGSLCISGTKAAQQAAGSWMTGI
jgi:hypothetical protein